MTRALPAELLARIVTYLLPSIDACASTLPHPSGSDLEYAPPVPSNTSADLLSVCLSCSLLHELAQDALYRAPLVRTLKALNLLASTIAADAKPRTSPGPSRSGSGQRATMMRAIHLPPGDGLLQPGDTLADQNGYKDGLRVLLDHASELEFIWLEHRQAGAAFLELLHPRTVCRPRRLTLSNLSFSAPPFSSIQSLAPLSKLTHLHLIKIVPPPALISFVVGEAIHAEEQGNVPESINKGLSPCGSLECLRLSLLPPDALVEFEAYVAWRRAWKEYEQLDTHQQAQLPAPRAPLGPARRFAVQEALYDLAVRAARLPRLRLVLLELSPLGSLAPPSSLFSTARQSIVSPKAVLEDRRAQVSDQHTFRASMRTMQHHQETTTGGDGGLGQSETALMPTGEELRTEERDRYWRLVEAGKHALVNLWGESCDELPELRVVSARPNGHDRREGFLDYHCQTAASAGADVGCWADADVFDLVHQSPFLSYRADDFSQVWYWTGELPRSTTSTAGETKLIPSLIPL